MSLNLPLIDFDNNFNHPIAGLDEVGRGTLAGPVVAAAYKKSVYREHYLVGKWRYVEQRLSPPNKIR